MNELNNLIRQTEDPYKRSILKKLKPLCHQAVLHMNRSGGTWIQKYHAMWKTDFWKEARLLLKDYFTIDGILKCPICFKPIKDKFTLHHHELYPKDVSNLFNPLYCQLIHSEHHFKGL